jgi:hypothetical protein
MHIRYSFPKLLKGYIGQIVHVESYVVEFWNSIAQDAVFENRRGRKRKCSRLCEGLLIQDWPEIWHMLLLDTEK